MQKWVGLCLPRHLASIQHGGSEDGTLIRSVSQETPSPACQTHCRGSWPPFSYLRKEGKACLLSPTTMSLWFYICLFILPLLGYQCLSGMDGLVTLKVSKGTKKRQNRWPCLKRGQPACQCRSIPDNQCPFRHPRRPLRKLSGEGSFLRRQAARSSCEDQISFQINQSSRSSGRKHLRTTGLCFQLPLSPHTFLMTFHQFSYLS